MGARRNDPSGRSFRQPYVSAGYLERIQGTMDTSNQRDVIDFAEQMMRSNNCRITSFLSGGKTQLVVKKGKMSISPSFLSIRSLCEWVVNNEAELSKSIEE